MATPGTRPDTARLAALGWALMLDSPPERACDDITRLPATALAVPITMVKLLDAERDWFKSCVGVQQKGVAGGHFAPRDGLPAAG